ncbi:MAG: SMC-Scp complex subunit ScpB [Phycisphaeraceae bacterium]|nr:SMC-Scp complex subunit ScpB [Phycisphaeraceae bacterium]
MDTSVKHTDGAPTQTPAEPKPGGRARRPSEVLAPDAPSHDTQPEPDAASIAASLEAILISADRPIAPGKLAEALAPTHPGVTGTTIKAAVEYLNAAYAQHGRAFSIEPASGGLRIMTRPEHAEVLACFHGQRAQTRLTRAAVETLAIVAYQQPITRAKVEVIRGVACGEVLKTLIERRMVTIVGRAEELGRPMLYGTTRQFLEAFGLASLKDLPPPAEFALA